MLLAYPMKARHQPLWPQLQFPSSCWGLVLIMLTITGFHPSVEYNRLENPVAHPASFFLSTVFNLIFNIDFSDDSSSTASTSHRVSFQFIKTFYKQTKRLLFALSFECTFVRRIGLIISATLQQPVFLLTVQSPHIYPLMTLSFVG